MVPFNIASYALLTAVIAKLTNCLPGEFIHTYGDLHIYNNHRVQVLEQLARSSFEAPTLKIEGDIQSIDDLKPEHIQLEGYVSHPPIAAKMAV